MELPAFSPQKQCFFGIGEYNLLNANAGTQEEIAVTERKDTEPKDDEATSEVESSEPVTSPVEPEVEAAVDTEVEVTPTEEQVEEAIASEKKSSRKVLVWILVAILIVGGFFIIRNQRSGNDLAKIQGKVALSASELRDIVVAKKITAYWAGPQDGAKYTLIATTPGVAFVRYLPGGVGLNDTKTLFRAIGTYAQKNAFAVSTAGAAANGNVGFVNADGNAVFYSKVRPSNVYVGIKGKDIQVEVFDPVVDQAIGLVLVKNQVRQIS